MKKRIMTRNGTYPWKKNIAIGIMFLLIWASFVPLIGAANQTIPQRHDHQLSQADTHGLKENIVQSIKEPDHVRKNSTVPAHDIQVNHVRTHEPRKRLALPEQLRVSNNVYQDSTIISKSQDGEVFPLGSNPQVHNNRTNEYFNTIQAAINDANTANGDAIWVNSTDFTENVKVNKSVVLYGRNTGSGLPRLNAGHGIGFNITVNNVTICRFNISNAAIGIFCNRTSGVTVQDNMFWHDNRSISILAVKTMSANENYTIYDNSIVGNDFYENTSQQQDGGVFVNIGFNYLNHTGNVSIGNFNITSNHFFLNGSKAFAVVCSPLIQRLKNGSISIGTMNISENTIYNASNTLYYGVLFDGCIQYCTNDTIDVEDLIVTNNTIINQSCITLDINSYDAFYWNGTTTGVFGDLLVSDNTVNSSIASQVAILVSVGSSEHFWDNASLMVGACHVEGNDVNVSGAKAIEFYMQDVGVYLWENSSIEVGDVRIAENVLSGSHGIDFTDYYWGYTLNDKANCTIGSFQVVDNTIDAASAGMYMNNLGSFGEDMSGHAVFSMGDLNLSCNTITSGGPSIYVGNEQNIGYDLSDNASVTVGGFLINDNTLAGGTNGICFDNGIYCFGYGLSENATFSMGDIQVNHNVITSDEEDGIYVYGITDFGENLGDDQDAATHVTMGSITFNGNIINYAGGSGIYIDGNDEYSGFEYFGYEMYGSSTFTMQNVEFNSNTINSSSDGIYVYGICDFGEYLYDASIFTMGSFTFNTNTINTTEGEGNGIAIGTGNEDDYTGVSYFGYDLYGTSTFVMQDFQMNGNNIISSYCGIYIDGYNYDDDEWYSFWLFGYDIEDTATFTMGNITFNENNIVSQSGGIVLDDRIYYFGYELYGSSSFEMGGIQFNDNVIDSYSDGIYVDDISDFGEELGSSSEDAVSFVMGDISFNRNVIDCYQEGITDDISDTVHLARGYRQGIYNSVTESSFDSDVSPENTEWSSVLESPVEDPPELSYTNWRDAVETNAPYMVGRVIYMHIITEGRYFEMHFTSWSEGGGGGFSYTRYEIIDGEADDGVTFTRPNTGDGIGIDIDRIRDFGYDMYGTSSFTMGDIQFNDNVIDSYDDSIYVDYFDNFGGGLGSGSEDAVSFAMGNILFNRNELTSYDGNGLYIDGIDSFGHDVYGSSSFIMGSIHFNDNVIDSYDGIYVSNMGYFGSSMYDDASFIMGNITFNGNTIDCYQGGDAGGKSIGLDIRSIRFLCSYLDGNSSFTMHDIQINDNTITSYSNSIYLPDIGIGQVMYTNSTGFMGNITLNNNTVYSDGGDGIFFINTASTLDIGSELHDNSTFSVNNIELRNNNITHADGDGMWVAALGAGYDIEDDAVFTLDSFMVANNTIIDSDTGLHVMELNLIDWCTPIITNNTITDCVVGISLESSNDNLIYNNYFNNTINAQDDGENTWNVTKTSGANIMGGSYLGGNYWSDYDGVDQDSDGLGDTLTPYNSSGDIETDGDFHPLINITVVESGNNGGGTSSNQAPIAHAGGPYSGYVNHTISFSGSGSTDDTAVVGYHWDFTNDGIYDTGWLTTSTTTHTYTTIGTYTVNLQVKDGAGLTDTDTATVTITATTTQTYPPVAHAGGPYSGLTFQDITFVGSGSTDDGTITSYAWSFGDGTTGTGVTALHRYTTTGVFTIILIVTDNDGFTNTSTTTATITLDSDGDGISDAVEEQLGSNPDNASGVVPLVIAGTSDYLVDTNGDGILDTFYNTQTGTHSTTKLQADGTYLIDVNGDGTWEFIYDPAYGTTTAYKKESPGGFPWLIVGIILAIIVLVVVVLVKKRRL